MRMKLRLRLKKFKEEKFFPRCTNTDMNTNNRRTIHVVHARVVVAVALARFITAASGAHGHKPTRAIKVRTAASVVETTHALHAVGAVELWCALQTVADLIAECVHLAVQIVDV